MPTNINGLSMANINGLFFFCQFYFTKALFYLNHILQRPVEICFQKVMSAQFAVPWLDRRSSCAAPLLLATAYKS